jgi:hypothetical protein
MNAATDDEMFKSRTVWADAMRAKGHTPSVDEDDGWLNIFAYDVGQHNGPGCSTCGWACCWHCDDIKDIPECTNPALELEAAGRAATK